MFVDELLAGTCLFERGLELVNKVEPTGPKFLALKFFSRASSKHFMRKSTAAVFSVSCNAKGCRGQRRFESDL